ncbi:MULTISPECIES: class I SAM-dependent methyltransferase [unclassified Myroides]|uniref:class I SAM-dependent methyltransferase n=1 Tax=unclassified Myroides TaxID=2642485 RepID=UPI003D2F784A
MMELSKYENEDFVQAYMALWSYGYLNNYAYSEGLYRTIISLVVSNLEKTNKKKILDVGCGVGRTTFDLAKIYKKSFIIALDESKKMIETAKEINSSSYKGKMISLANRGFKDLKLPSFSFPNIKFLCENFERYNFVDNNFDLIVNVNYLDRCGSIEYNIKKFFKILADDGLVVGCSPLNFQNEDSWETYKSVDNLREVIEKTGFEIIDMFDNLVYKEILDARESFEEYKVVCYVLKKKTK